MDTGISAVTDVASIVHTVLLINLCIMLINVNIGRRLPDIITCAKFYTDRFRDFDSVCMGSTFALLH